MCLDLFLFEAIRRCPLIGAFSGACQTLFSGNVEDQRQVGHHAIDGDALQCLDEVRFQIACRALIDTRGIEKAVAEHHGTLVQCRTDHLFDVVVACCGKQNGFHANAK